MHYRHALWAKQHDWFKRLEAIPNQSLPPYDYSVIVREFTDINNDGTLVETEKEFTNYEALREWAGY